MGQPYPGFSIELIIGSNGWTCWSPTKEYECSPAVKCLIELKVSYEEENYKLHESYFLCPVSKQHCAAEINAAIFK